jgi:hypothetical protein
VAGCHPLDSFLFLQDGKKSKMDKEELFTSIMSIRRPLGSGPYP